MWSSDVVYVCAWFMEALAILFDQTRHYPNHFASKSLNSSPYGRMYPFPVKIITYLDGMQWGETSWYPVRPQIGSDITVRHFV